MLFYARNNPLPSGKHHTYESVYCWSRVNAQTTNSAEILFKFYYAFKKRIKSLLWSALFLKHYSGTVLFLVLLFERVFLFLFFRCTFILRLTMIVIHDKILVSPHSTTKPHDYFWTIHKTICWLGKCIYLHAIHHAAVVIDRGGSPDNGNLI